HIGHHSDGDQDKSALDFHRQDLFAARKTAGSVSGPAALGKQLVPEVLDLGPQGGRFRVTQGATQQDHYIQAPEAVRPVTETFSKLAFDTGTVHGAAGTLARNHHAKAMQSERVVNGEKQKMPAAGPVT